MLAFGAEEAVRLNHRHIGTEHLLLGLLHEEKHPAAQLLRSRGADLVKLRLEISQLPTLWSSGQPGLVSSSSSEFETVEMHGDKWNLEYIRGIVKTLRELDWYWDKRNWEESDVVTRLSDGSISRDLRLAADSANFRVVARGWKKDECLICNWELFQSEDDPEHGVGYTNGWNWLCTECYEKFVAQNAQGLNPNPED